MWTEMNSLMKLAAGPGLAVLLAGCSDGRPDAGTVTLERTLPGGGARLDVIPVSFGFASGCTAPDTFHANTPEWQPKLHLSGTVKGTRARAVTLVLTDGRVEGAIAQVAFARNTLAVARGKDRDGRQRLAVSGRAEARRVTRQENGPRAKAAAEQLGAAEIRAVEVELDLPVALNATRPAGCD